MKKHLLLAGVLGGLLLSAGCAKKEGAAAAKAPELPKATTVAVVKEQERSRHFLAVNKELELGGSLYGYADVDGDALKLAGMLGEVLGQVAATQPAAAPFLKQDYPALFTALGVTDVKAAGFSSVPDGTGYYRNRTFFYTAGERHGLLASLGGKPGPFARVGLAPADTDAYFESELDLPAIYATVREMAAKIGGAAATESMEAQLKRTGESAAFSLYSFIQGLKGRAALVLRLDGERELRVPGARGEVVVLPAVSLLMCLDGVAAAVEPTLAKSPFFKVTQDGSMKLYEIRQPLPLQGIQPVLAIEGTTVYLATTADYLRECRAASAGGLAEKAEYKEALAHVGAEGNALGYVNPKFFQQLRRIETLNPHLPAEGKQMLRMVLRSLPETPRPLVTVRRNLPDGILVQSYWNRSLKQDVATLAVYNPVTIGLLAAMAIPAFEKVRSASQEKAVLNNLRQLAAAADQYYLENGVATATYDQLVGPDKYVRQINPVAGETYRDLVFRQGVPLQATTANGHPIRYPSTAAPVDSGGPFQTLVLTASEANRVKVVQESDGATLFNGPLGSGESTTIKKQGRLAITVQSGKDLHMKVDGRNFPVPLEGYGRFRLD